MSALATSFMRFGLNVIGRSGLANAIKPVFGGVGAVLMLHHVGNRAPSYFGGNDHLSIKPEFLTQILDEFRQECIDIVSLDEAIWRMKADKKTTPFVALTFDDGYRDNIETAYPILQSFRVPFTIFVCSGFVDRKVPIWWLSLESIIQANNEIELYVDGTTHQLQCVGKTEKSASYVKAVNLLKNAPFAVAESSLARLYDDYQHDPLALVDQEMSTWEMLSELTNDPLVTIGAHTVSHPFLPKLSRDQACLEMMDSRDRIKEMTGCDTEFFAYPYGFAGAAGPREVRLAEEMGFKAAFTTRRGTLSAEHANHMCALPRVSINGHYQNMGAMRALLSGFPFYVSNRFTRVKTL